MRSLLPTVAAASLLLIASAIAQAAPGTPPLADWPCKGCLTLAPASDGSPRPLLIALHGDDAGTAKLFRALRPACEQAGVILVSLRCPVDLGCRTSYWQWQGTTTHEPGWIRAQIAATAARFVVDPARVYAAGYSGGATYLGWYAPTFPSDFKAIAHIAGGMPWGTPCPACKVPVLFTLGAGDPMLVPYTRPLRDYYEACGGHEIVWQTLRGVTHDGILPTVQAGKGSEILAWLLAHRAACGDPAPVAEASVDAGIESPPPLVDRGPSVSAPSASPPSSPSPTDARSPLQIAPRPSSCACDVGAGARQGRDVVPALGLALALALALLATRRSRSP